MKKYWLLCFSLIVAANAQSETLHLNIELPQLDVSPYHRPYVAAWLESSERQGIHTLAIWYDDTEWLKDVRQWWRKLGRSSEYDAVTGATRPPGTYSLQWDGQLGNGEQITAGQYYLNVEASREEGGREYLRQLITLGAEKPYSQVLQGQRELGSVHIEIKP